MPKYRIVSGKHHHSDLKVYQPGDIIEIPKEMAEGMPDRFEQVVEEKPKFAPASAPKASTSKASE